MTCRLSVICAVILAALASVNSVRAQGLDLGVGWHRFAEKTPHGRGAEAGARLPSGQPMYTVGVFLNDFGDRHKWRFGFRYTTHQTLHEVNGIGKSFRMQCFLLDYQRQVLWRKPSRVVVDVCAGLWHVSTHVPYEYSEPSTELWIHVSTPAAVAPGLGWQCQVASQLTLQAVLWYYWLQRDLDEVTPFRSGPALSLGLGYTIGAK